MSAPFESGARVRTFRTRVRYGETDRMGVVWHGNYVSYFEMGRTEFMREAGLPYSELERRGVYLVVVEVGARYRANVGYDAELVIRTAVSDVGPATVAFAYRIEDSGGRLLCEGHTRLASVTPALKPVRLPEDVAKLLRA